MSKHPLLPKDYSDSATQSAIIFALSPYKITDRNIVINPQLKWNLHKAWGDAHELLASGAWKYRGNNTAEIGYEFVANTDKEIEELNTIIAGIVAHQILEPEYGLAFQRIDYKKGGEVSLFVSASVGEKLKQLLPARALLPVSETSHSHWWNLSILKRWIKIGNKE
jgi:hypothetical protein